MLGNRMTKGNAIARIKNSPFPLAYVMLERLSRVEFSRRVQNGISLIPSVYFSYDLLVVENQNRGSRN